MPAGSAGQRRCPGRHTEQRTTMILLLAQGTDIGTASTVAEWLKFGLLGAVLFWLFFWHLPAKDAQIKTLLELFASEREKDRHARHEQSEKFSQNLTSVLD